MYYSGCFSDLIPLRDNLATLDLIQLVFTFYIVTTSQRGRDPLRCRLHNYVLIVVVIKIRMWIYFVNFVSNWHGNGSFWPLVVYFLKKEGSFIFLNVINYWVKYFFSGDYV